MSCSPILEVLLGQRVIGHDAVLELGSFEVDGAAARLDAVGADLADDAKGAAVVVERVREVARSIFVLFGEGVSAFDHAHRLVEVEIFERELEVGVVGVEVGHGHIFLIAWP